MKQTRIFSATYSSLRLRLEAESRGRGRSMQATRSRVPGHGISEEMGRAGNRAQGMAYTIRNLSSSTDDYRLNPNNPSTNFLASMPTPSMAILATPPAPSVLASTPAVPIPIPKLRLLATAPPQDPERLDPDASWLPLLTSKASLHPPASSDLAAPSSSASSSLAAFASESGGTRSHVIHQPRPVLAVRSRSPGRRRVVVKVERM